MTCVWYNAFNSEYRGLSIKFMVYGPFKNNEQNGGEQGIKSTQQPPFKQGGKKCCGERTLTTPPSMIEAKEGIE